MKLSIIVPCFNEGKNIISFIDKCINIIQNNNTYINTEIIIVDGHSSDNTTVLLHEKFKYLDKNNFKIIFMPNKKGYGYDIMQGLKVATGDVLSWTHGDLQTDPNDVFRAFEIYKKNVNDLILIKGARKNRKLLDTAFTFGMQLIAFIVLRVYLRDINAQPKLFSSSFYNNYLVENNAPSDFSFDLFVLYTAKKSNYKILSFSVNFLNREFGEAKGGGGSWKNRLNLIKRTFLYIIKLRKQLK